MPKSSSLTCPSTRDHHVGGLDVPVHDQIRVRVLDGFEHVQEQAEPGVHVQPVLVAIAIDGQPLHVLEHEIRLTRRRHARVEEPGDVGMREPREDVAFALEPLLAGAPHERHVQQLDGRVSREAAVAALRQPDAAHPAVPDVRDHAVGAESAVP